MVILANFFLLATFGWIAVAASAPFLSGTMIQGLLVLNYDDYVFQRWRGTLLYWGILVISAFVNIKGSRLLSLIEYLSLAFHVGAFLAVLVVICVVSPTKHDAKFVFTETINSSGWSHDGIAWCVGLLSGCYVLIGKNPSFYTWKLLEIDTLFAVPGYDGAIHLSEEMRNPRIDIPTAMIGTIIINGTMGFGFLVAVLFCMGDMDSTLNTRTGYPIIQIFWNITGNVHSATALCCTVVIMAGLASIPLLMSASRMLWVLARDKGKNIIHYLFWEF